MKESINPILIGTKAIRETRLERELEDVKPLFALNRIITNISKNGGKVSLDLVKAIIGVGVEPTKESIHRADQAVEELVAMLRIIDKDLGDSKADVGVLRTMLRQAGLKSSEEHYQGAAETLAVIAEEIMGLDLPAEVIKMWKELFVALRTVDHVIDNITDNQEREELVSSLNKFLDGNAINFSYGDKFNTAMKSVRTLSDNLPDGRKKPFINSLKNILTITENIRTESDISEFAKLTRIEGQITSRIFLQFLPEEFVTSSEYPKLIKAFTRLGRAANSFDTFVDLPDDYDKGQAAVKPTPLNRLLLFNAIIADGISFLKNAKLSANLLDNLLKRSKETINNSSNRFLRKN